MAMLAEPRRKQKIGPNPRGKFFMEDASNRGRTLLQKLGWQSGDGLGKQNQGMNAPLCPKIQMDSRGLGFDPKNDPWVAHNEEFSQILENLSPIGPADSSKAKLIEEETEDKNSDREAEGNGKLESKSKKSKFRIHYHKFVRNKDVSNFSKTDLKCIFGKPTDALISKDSAGSETEGKTEDDGSEGFKTVNSGSMADYFKNKMQKIRDASKLKQEEKTEDEKQNQINRGSMFDYFKAKLEERRVKAAQDAENKPIISADEVDTSIVETEETLEAIEEPQRKSKKSKRKADNAAENETAPAKKSKKSKAENTEEVPAESNGLSDPVSDLIDAQKDRNRSKREKRKKAKNSSDYEVLITEENTEAPETPEQEDNEPPKKKKKKKSKESSDLPTEDSQEANTAPEQVDPTLVEKKDKKKKKKKHEEVAIEDRAPLLQETETPAKKSKKKSKLTEAVPEMAEAPQEEEPIEKSKKKKKKKKETDSSDEPILAADSSTQEEPEQAPAEDGDSQKKKKKKDKRHLEAGELNDISKSFPGANLHKIPGYAFY